MTENQYDPQPMGKPILCLDFDGVIHSYTSGWKGVKEIPDPPVPGVFEWMKKAIHIFDIHIYSSRSMEAAGRKAMYLYIRDHGGDSLATQVVYVSEKPRAFISIDDRCVQFNGDWSDPMLDPEMLRKFKPWNKR